MAQNGQLSHEEMWDDSELIDDWSAAFEEYKKYHSMAARGDKAEPVLEKQQPNLNEGEEIYEPQESVSNALPNGDAQPNSSSVLAEVQASAGAQYAPATASQSLPGLASVPQALSSSMQTEEMKNVMMSWYYAGYYTGFLEGQQKAYASMQQQQTG